METSWELVERKLGAEEAEDNVEKEETDSDFVVRREYLGGGASIEDMEDMAPPVEVVSLRWAFEGTKKGSTIIIR